MSGSLTSKPMARVTISSVTFSDGTKVSLSENDVVLLVGPNNAGKSAALRGIIQSISAPASGQFSAIHPVIKSIGVQRSGTFDDLLYFLTNWSNAGDQREEYSYVDDTFQSTFYGTNRKGIELLRPMWENKQGKLAGIMIAWFARLLDVDSRLELSKRVAHSPEKDEPPDPHNPVKRIYRDDRRESSLSQKFRKAFGTDLIVNRLGGKYITLHVGDRPMPHDGEDRLSYSYLQRIQRLPTLQSQGDGMRSYAATLLASFVGSESILLVDEPEAFLHPPHARLLGATLAADRTDGRQLFIATHSTDVLRGLLDSGGSDVKVIRIQRDGSVNSVRLLSNQRVKELWSDPLLRQSNILDGLFHEMVVICEADSDCRFYGAVHDAISSTLSEDTKRLDLMFTHCGGKHRLPVVIRALGEMGVPVRVIADFDILSEAEPLKSVVAALGLDWTAVEADWKLVKNGIDSKKAELSALEVKSAIGKILAGVTAPSFPNAAGVEIQKVLKRSSAWANAKQGGRQFIPSGDPTKAFARLTTTFRAAGLFVVEIGELEGFVRTEGDHGPKWVNAVLGRSLATDSELEEARRFVSAVTTEPV